MSGHGSSIDSTLSSSASTIDYFDEIYPVEIHRDLKVYKRRWVILLIFVLYAASNGVQWIQYSIINNIVVKFYGVHEMWVDWTSIIYMVTYVPLVFPASYLLDKFGLRISVIVGMVGTCGGAWIKVASAGPSLFWVGFLAQTIVAISQIFILSLPSRVAAVWFGPRQVSMACGIGVFGTQLGEALGFIISPYLVADSENLEDIGSDMLRMFYYESLYCTILLVIILLFFKDQPPTPPSTAQDTLKQRHNYYVSSKPSFGKSLKNLVTNKDYMLLFGAYGIIIAIYYALSTLLNPLILLFYPGQEIDAGRIGLLMVFSGMLGNVVFGTVLDKTHKFKETSLGIYICGTLGLITFSFTLNTGYIAVVYVTACFSGFFMIAFMPVGYEFGAELTFPEPEGTSSGLLMAAAQGFGMIFTIVYSSLLTNCGDIIANVTMISLLVVGVALTSVIHPHLRRQAAQNK